MKRNILALVLVVIGVMTTIGVAQAVPNRLYVEIQGFTGDSKIFVTVNRITEPPATIYSKTFWSKDQIVEGPELEPGVEYMVTVGSLGGYKFTERYVAQEGGIMVYFHAGQEVRVVNATSDDPLFPSEEEVLDAGEAQVVGSATEEADQPETPPPPAPTGYNRNIQMGFARYNHRIENPKTNGPGWQVFEGMSNDAILRQHEPGEDLYAQGGFSPENTRTTRYITDAEQADMVKRYRVPHFIEWVLENYPNVKREDIIILEPTNQFAGVLLYKLPKPLEPAAPQDLVPPKPKVKLTYKQGLTEPEADMVVENGTWVFNLRFPPPPEPQAKAKAFEGFGLELHVGPYANYGWPYSNFQSGGLGRLALRYNRFAVYGEGTVGAEFLRPGDGMVVRSHMYGMGGMYHITESWAVLAGFVQNAQSFLGGGESVYTSNGAIVSAQFWPLEWLFLEAGFSYAKLKTADKGRYWNREDEAYILKDEFGVRAMIGIDLMQIIGSIGE